MYYTHCDTVLWKEKQELHISGCLGKAGKEEENKELRAQVERETHVERQRWQSQAVECAAF